MYATYHSVDPALWFRGAFANDHDPGIMTRGLGPIETPVLEVYFNAPLAFERIGEADAPQLFFVDPHGRKHWVGEETADFRTRSTLGWLAATFPGVTFFEPAPDGVSNVCIVDAGGYYVSRQPATAPAIPVPNGVGQFDLSTTPPKESEFRAFSNGDGTFTVTLDSGEKVVVAANGEKLGGHADETTLDKDDYPEDF